MQRYCMHISKDVSFAIFFSSASVKLQKESRQFKLMEEWANNFGTTWSIVELAGERMQLIGDLRSWSPTDVEVSDLCFLEISEN